MADLDACSDSNHLGNAIASAVLNAIDDACAERDCYTGNPQPDCICDAFCDIRAVAYPHPRTDDRWGPRVWY